MQLIQPKLLKYITTVSPTILPLPPTAVAEETPATTMRTSTTATPITTIENP